MRAISVLLLAIICIDVSAASLEGKVISVHDGDSITILDANRRSHKIRLAQIDAPEISQAFGNQCKKSLSDLIFGRSVKVVQEDVDRYNRVVGRVYVKGIDVSAEQVKRGMAWVYRKYATDKGLYGLENSAKTSKAGLWLDPHAIPPWEYRHGSNSSNSNSSNSNSNSSNSNSNSSNDGKKRTCGQMSSCKEAMYYMKDVGLYRLDSDKDGVPCESLCR